ncbi:MAG TPA: ABC transporter substrate-binding protein [Mycobacteriales bacterium]|nr:ABC transporter substrate-binding protein [Mycobacteriales bacterium]
MRHTMTFATRLTAAAAGLALALAGCGGSSTSPGGGATTTPAGVSLPDLTGQKLEVAAVWTGAEQAGIAAVLDAFSAKTHATVKYTATGDDIATVLGTRIKGGQPPDVAFLPQPGLLNELASDGSLKPVDADVAAAVDANYAPIWKTLGTVKGTLYGVWFKAANKSTVWYRTAAFDQAGVQPPASWDDLLKGAQTIADSGTTPVSVGGADGWTLTDWFENVYLRSAGPAKYDQLAKHQIPWTDASVKTALGVLAQLWGKKGLVVPGALQTDFPTSVTQVFSASPKGAIVFEGDFVAGVIASETKAKVGTDANFFDFPSVNGSPASVVGGGDVATALKSSPGAQALLRFLASPEAATIWAKRGGYTSVNKNVDLAAYPDDTSRKIAKALVGSGDAFRFDMSDLAPAGFGGTPGGGEWKILQDFLANPTNVDGTATKLEAAASAVKFPT